jgi:hypothetical protein
VILYIIQEVVPKSRLFRINIHNYYKKTLKGPKMLTALARNVAFAPVDSEKHGPSLKYVLIMSSRICCPGSHGISFESRSGELARGNTARTLLAGTVRAGHASNIRRYQFCLSPGGDHSRARRTSSTSGTVSTWLCTSVRRIGRHTACFSQMTSQRYERLLFGCRRWGNLSAFILVLAAPALLLSASPYCNIMSVSSSDEHSAIRTITCLKH